MTLNRSGKSDFNHITGSFRKCKKRLEDKPARILLFALALLATLYSAPSDIDAQTFVSGKIKQDTTWSLAGSPYIVTGDVTVCHSESRGAPAATLTIEAGVVVRFEPGTGLYIGYKAGHPYYHSYYGALDAQGTEAAPIIFTSNSAAPAPGDWKGIYFRDQTREALTAFDHCVVEYGGLTNSANLYMVKASPSITNSTVRYGSANGIYLNESSSDIKNCDIVNNGESGLHLTGSSNPAIGGEAAGNNISRNGTYGIYSAGSGPFPAIIGNIISNNGAYPIRTGAMMNVIDNNCRGNGLQAIEVVPETISADTSWRNNGVSYVVTGDITVRHSETRGRPAATLSIDPGVEIRFEPGTGLYFGYRGGHPYYHQHFGALSAQGTESAPITFTSNAIVPAPGDWKGIYFRDQTKNGLTRLEHCRVEYGGNTHNANIYLANAEPTIQYSTIRNSSHSGIYIAGTGSDNATIRCNNLKDNLYGVYLAGNAKTVVTGNNFLRNRNYGVNNTGTSTVDAAGNWWGDINGPGYNGDDVSANVNITPWLDGESGCIDTPPTNSPPFQPAGPFPENDAVRVPVLEDGQSIPVLLDWSGGDPNPWDAVVYDVYLGTVADNLVRVIEAVESPSCEMPGLAVGTTYYWKIVARDNEGAEAAGPVWHFTTLGEPPDIVVSELSWNPESALQAGQTITLTATVENTGDGPVVDAFEVEFFVDGGSIGSQTANPVLHTGNSISIERTWTAEAGNHSIEVRADSKQAVLELNEENNKDDADLPDIMDPTPPDLVGTVPADGTFLVQVDEIAFTLNDRYGEVDDAAVIGSVAVLDVSGRPIGFTVSENNDHFRVTPASLPLNDDTYRVSLTAVDLAGNDQNYSFSFTIDKQVPVAPVITGGTVTSGVIQARPGQNSANSTIVTLSGTREDNTGIWIDSQLKVNSGSGDWSLDLTLPQGDNSLEILAADPAGNRSPAVWVDIVVDSIAPAISAVVPANNSFVNIPPAAVVIGYQEAGSGLSIDNSNLSIKDGNLMEFTGTWGDSGGNQLTFTPAFPFADSNYTIRLQLVDNLGNRGAELQYDFTVDTAPPSAPEIRPVTSPTHNTGQVVTGTKEAYAAILADGQQVMDHTVSTDWQHTVSLASGANQIAFAARDRAGNQSGQVSIEIIFDDIPPLPVDTLRLNCQGDGTTVDLNWSGYDETGHGDVAYYRIYAETAAFSNVSGLTPRSTVPAGHFSAALHNLSRNTEYWFAVVAVDVMGNSNPAASAVAGRPVDVLPPENVTNLYVQSFGDRLIFTWDHSADVAGDLAAYRIAFADDITGEVIASTLNTYEKSGLAPATGYRIKVFAVDRDNNESDAVTATGVTLLPNPANLAADPQSGYVTVNWDGSTPVEYVSHYAVYVSDNNFSTVEGLSPVITTKNTSAKIAGLANGNTYYFAVTAVNISGGENKSVSTIAATPLQDTSGPEISDVKIDGAVLTDGHTLTGPARFTAVATDPAGISRLEFTIDAEVTRVDYTPEYSCFWNAVSVSDGDYTLEIKAYDTLGNSTSIDFNLVVALEPPAAPAITGPVGGTLTNQRTITVSGQAEKYTEVMVYSNSAEAGAWTAVDALGAFSVSTTLFEGENHLRAAARNRSGIGPLSSEVLVSLDTSLPESPGDLAADARQGGVVRLTWQPPADTTVAGYNLYRSQGSFIAPDAASKINNDLITATAFSDLPATEGTWHYRVTTFDSAGNESELSNEAVAVSDWTAPRAVSIEYNTQGPYDRIGERMAPGTVNVLVTVNEPLQATPYLSIAPEGGIPLAVALTRVADLIYSGFFVIPATAPDGTAYAIFSGRDVAGNRGTEIDDGTSIRIDTGGPAIGRLEIDPGSPIQNDAQSPVSMTATIGLNEKLKPGTLPQLSYLLSGEGRQPIDIAQLTEIVTRPGDAQTWQAQFTLPANAGQNQAETFHFIYLGADDLDNIGNRIMTANLFQVYQGELPPLEPPRDLIAASLPEGRIQLAWNPVDEAAGYQLYRKAPGESDLTEYRRLDRVETYTDQTAVDGLYTYTVASIRRENSQETLSGQSAAVTAVSDSVPPQAPLDLALELVANGIKAEWSPPPFTEEVTYSLYRATASGITSVEGLSPLATGIPQTLVVDPTPSPSAHCYVVTAVDAVGNESPPSNSYYLNFQLLPVSAITVVQAEDNPPLVTWTHPGGDIAGYDIFLGPENDTVRLNPSLLTEPSFVDAGYARDERRYTIITRDNSGVESLGRSISLPQLAAALAEGSRIKRGVMNRLNYVVLNGGSSPVENIRLKVRVGSHDHTSDKFSLDPGTSRTVPVVVGGYDDLENIAALTTTIEVSPAANESIRIVRRGDIEVDDGMLVLQILNEEFTRAATGQVRFTLENTGEAEIEITTAGNSGKSPSSQIVFYLLDEDDNVLASKAFKQTIGDRIVTLPNRNTVARIGAGETFTSDFLTIPVPSNVPDDVIIRLEISHVYYRQDQATQVTMKGLAGTHRIAMVDTAYFGEVTDIAPRISTGDQDIVITGRAVERLGGDSMANVPLNLVITSNGFERAAGVYTNDDGFFHHSFKPLKGESGVYKVRAVHPDRTDKPVHGQFVINRVSVTPSVVNLSVPKNYNKTVSIRVNTGEGTAVNNLRLEYHPEDQPAGQFPEGVHLTVGAPKSYLGGNKTAWLPFTLWADNTADTGGKLVLKVKSDESEPGAWGHVAVNMHFAESRPVLHFTPDHIETGLSRENTVSETVTLENRGLAPLNDVMLSLHNLDGSPAPNWVYLTSSTKQDPMEVGGSRDIGIAFSPTADVTEGNYSFGLQVRASNHPATTINLYVAVTREGQGNALFKVSDIYTGTIDKNGDVIQGLAGARVVLQNEAVLTEAYTASTDVAGEAWFEGIPSGRYKCRITAKNHQEYIGRIWIKPAISVNEDVFLDYNLVTVEWEVNEISIEDKYELVLTATYETDVPAAVVAVKPSSVNLPAMKAGDVFNGEFTLTNYGLIRADDLRVSLPPDDQYFTYELLAGLPDSLSAKEQITVPYRVTCVRSPDQQDDGQATGGGCHNYRTCAVVNYGYVCANGQSTKAATNHCWTRTYGDCSTGGGNGIITTGSGGGTWNVGGGGAGGGTVSKPAPKPKTIQGVTCFPKPSLKERFFGWWNSTKETLQNWKQKVGCDVNTITRQFTDDEVDLLVKVPDGVVEIQRRYYDGSWKWEHLRNRLIFSYDSLQARIASIDKGGVEYEANGSDGNVYVSETFRITRQEDGYRWQDKFGRWQEYNNSGRLLKYGSRSGVTAKLLYESDEEDRLVGISDRDDNQVIWYEYDGNGQISAIRDADNRQVSYSYADGRLTTVTDVLDNETTYEYDGQGRITRKVDAGGRPTVVAYDQYGNVSSVVDQNGTGHFFEFDYDEGKKESYTRITTSAGRIKEVWYDKDGETKRVDINGRTLQSIVKDGRNLIVTDEKGKVLRKEYDEWDNLTRIVYPDGSTVSFEYEHTFNRPVRVVDQRGFESIFEYDDRGNLTRKIEAIGTEAERVTVYTYDGFNQLLSATIKADANTAAAMTTFTYDDDGNLTSITDPENNTTKFVEYDAMGNLLRMKDPRDNEWIFGYDALGRLQSQSDPLDSVTSYEYDGANNRTAVINAFLKRFEFEYDDHNNLIKAVDPYQKFIATAYNTDNLPTRVTDQQGKVSQVQYDSEGRVLKTIDGAGNQIVYTYDETAATTVSSYKPVRIDFPTFSRRLYYDQMERVVQEVDVLDENASRSRSYVYDAAGNVIASTDEQDNTTQFEYDALNRLIKSTDALDGVTKRTYDDRGNLIAIENPNNGITYYDYDRNNRLVKTIRPMLQATTYEYDASGNRTAVYGTKGQKIAYDYNAVNRLTQVRYYEAGDHDNPVKTVDFTYDKLGNIKTYDDGTTSAIYTYDDLQRKVRETVDYGLFSKSVEYSYYANGLKKDFTGPDGVTIDYTYDDNNRISGIAIPEQGQITYNSYEWNSPARRTLPGGSTTEYSYDHLMQIESIVANDPGQNPLMTRDYTYSAAGNITAKDTEHGVYQYQYDDLQRLTDAVNPLSGDEVYSYDALGNRLTAAKVPGNWSYNANNELLGYGDISYLYDDNGNTIRKTHGFEETNYIYDVEDRLVRVEDGIGSQIASYYYDPFGRRLFKEVDGNRTYFVYSDEGLIGEYDQTGTEIRGYGYAPDSQWGTDPLFYRQQGKYYWYQNDHLGTPQKIIEANGRVAWSAVYDSFGNVRIETAEVVNNLRFAGQYLDDETGLFYNLNRYYDPGTGRYLRMDPFGEGLNLYAYVFNDPVSRIDPFGLCTVKRGWDWSTDKFWEGMDYVSDFSAGFGDTLTLGGTKLIRDQWQEAFGWDNPVESSSNAFTVGKWSSYAWELVFGAAGATKMVGKQALLLGSKAGLTSGGIVGGTTFFTEIAKGRSLESALKSAASSGITSAVSTTLAASGVGYIGTGLFTMATSAVLQKNISGTINRWSIGASALPPSVGAAFLSNSGLSGITLGVVTGIISGPSEVFANVFFK